MCKRNVRSGIRLHSLIAISEASILIEFTIRSARILVVELLVGLSFCSARFMTSLRRSLYHDGAHRIETVVGLTCEETNWNVADQERWH